MRFALHTAPTPAAAALAARLTDGLRALDVETHNVVTDNTDVIIAIGGDGNLLRAADAALATSHIPAIYGLNLGHVGFLLNEADTLTAEENTDTTRLAQQILRRIEAAHSVDIRPLTGQLRTNTGETIELSAVNEISITRASASAVHIAVTVDGDRVLDELVGDGVLVATPAGSSAYNVSAGGPLLPIDAHQMCLTPICAYKPLRWPGAILPAGSTIVLDVSQDARRPAVVTADHATYEDARSVTVTTDPTRSLRLLFDPEADLAARIRQAQFEIS